MTIRINPKLNYPVWLNFHYRGYGNYICSLRTGGILQILKYELLGENRGILLSHDETTNKSNISIEIHVALGANSDSQEKRKYENNEY